MAPKKKQAAQKAAQAAGKKKASAVELSAAHHERVRSALKASGAGGAGYRGCPGSSGQEPYQGLRVRHPALADTRLLPPPPASCAWQDLALDSAAPPAATPSAPAAGQQSISDAVQRVLEAYRGLQAQGFRRAHIEQALGQLPLAGLSQVCALAAGGVGRYARSILPNC